MRWLFVLSLVAVPAALGFSIPRRDANGTTLAPTTVSDRTKLQHIAQKPRIFVMTDILNEPDDQQSVVRYLLYSNEFDTRGLCATTSTHIRDRGHPEAIQKIVEAYGEVTENLNQHVHPFNQYPTKEKMLSLITQGPAVYGKEAFNEPLSEGAALLIERLQESSQSLWVLIWGGPNTLAQALKHISENFTAVEAAALRTRIRVYAISDQDDTGEWIRTTYPDIFYIASIHAFVYYVNAAWRGMWESLPYHFVDKVSAPWIRENIQIGQLGAVYPDRPIGAEGDTPSFLYLISNGLGDPEHPTYGSWGGRWSYVNIGSSHYVDSADDFYTTETQGINETSNKVTVARWRSHFQNDMATRMQWSLTSDFSSTTHPPVPIINGTKGPAPISISTKPGAQLVFDASQTYDPDHFADSSQLEFQWYQYRTADYLVRSRVPDEFVLGLEALGRNATTPGELEANDAGFRNYTLGDQVRVTVPDEEDAYEYHLILQVTSKLYTELPIRRYLRVKILASQDDIHPDQCCAAIEVPKPKPTNWT